MVHASQTIASYWVPPRLVSFRRAYPRIAINLVARNTAEVEGRVDADDLVQQAVARDRLLLVVGSSHPWASRRSVKGPDLLAAEWVLRERGSGTRSEFEDALARCAVSADRLYVVLELPSNEAVRMAVEAGAGATVISRLAVQPSLRGAPESSCVRSARARLHSAAASRALLQQGGAGPAERDQRLQTARRHEVVIRNRAAWLSCLARRRARYAARRAARLLRRFRARLALGLEAPEDRRQEPAGIAAFDRGNILYCLGGSQAQDRSNPAKFANPIFQFPSRFSASRGSPSHRVQTAAGPFSQDRPQPCAAPATPLLAGARRGSRTAGAGNAALPQDFGSRDNSEQAVSRGQPHLPM
jgi:hypothetical protein